MSYSIEINKDTLRSPVNRILLCILAVVLAVLSFGGNHSDGAMKREDMNRVTAVFRKCGRYGSSGVNTNNIYLVFESGERLYIHSNCATDELTQRLFELEPGTRVEMLVDKSAGNITELRVNGEIWLAFETVQRTMNRLDRVFDWVGVVLFFAAAVLALSFPLDKILSHLKKRR